MADQQATFEINLRGDAKAQSRQLADQLSAVKDKFKLAQGAVEAFKKQLDEAKTAGAVDQIKALKSQLSAAKKVMSEHSAAASLLRDRMKELREKTREASAAAKEQTEKAKAVGAAMKAAGGPVQEVRDKLDTLKEIMGGGNAAAALFVGGFALLTAAVVAGTVAIVGAIASFGRWAIGTADAARSLGLLQEAAAGSAANSEAMTSQIDAMARKVPTARAELQKLYEETFTLANYSRLGGQAIQDTYEAIARSSAAMGDVVGKKIGDLITRSKDLGVVRISALDVQNTGIDYEKDLVAPLAKAMTKLGPVTAKAMADARAQLQIGGLKLDAGAKLVVDAVNARFGGINARQVLGLENQWKHFHDTLVSFTRGINLEPLLATVKHFFDMFNAENDVGAAVKQIVEVIGNGLVGAVNKGGPAAEDFFKGLVLDAQELVIAALQGKASIADMFKVDAGDLIRDLRAVVELLKSAAKGAKLVYDAVDYTSDALIELGQKTGLATGQTGGTAKGASFGGAVQAPANADGGVVGVPAPGEFWASVAPGETIVPKGAGVAGGGAGPVTVHVGSVTIQVGSADRGGAQQAARSFASQLWEELEAALVANGVPSRAVPA